jgi:hypothetical protein
MVFGVGEAMRFAQRLGIGRHVPCFVLVTDVGALQAELLPFAGMSAEEVHICVRDWVDGFYEANQGLFERWRAVEEEVQRLRQQANRTLSRVREWRDRAAEPWRRMKAVAALIESVGALEPGDAAAWQRALAGGEHWRMPEDVREAFRQAQGEARELEQRPRRRRAGAALCETLEQAQDAGEILAALEAVSEKICRELPPGPAAAVAEQRRRLRDRIGRGVGALVAWWHGCVITCRPSRTAYKKARRHWSYPPSDRAPDTGREHESLLGALQQTSSVAARWPATSH